MNLYSFPFICIIPQTHANTSLALTNECAKRPPDSVTKYFIRQHCSTTFFPQNDYYKAVASTSGCPRNLPHLHHTDRICASHSIVSKAEQVLVGFLTETTGQQYLSHSRHNNSNFYFPHTLQRRRSLRVGRESGGGAPLPTRPSGANFAEGA